MANVFLKIRGGRRFLRFVLRNASILKNLKSGKVLKLGPKINFFWKTLKVESLVVKFDIVFKTESLAVKSDSKTLFIS